MTAARKFAFDTVFAPDGAVLRDGSGFRAQFTRDEVEVEKATAFEQGRTDAIVRAEETAAQAMQRMANDVSTLLASLEAERATLRREAAAIALAAARVAAGKALEAFGHERIAAAVEDAMDQLRNGPRLIIRVPTESYVALKARFEAMAQASAYRGAVMTREDSSLTAGEVSIEWADGLVAFDRETLFARMEEIVARALTSAAAEESAS